MYDLIKNIIKKIRFIKRKTLRLLSDNVAGICSNRPILSSFYYLVFSREFDREHQAVLKGRLNYSYSVQNPESSSILLRRNIHRLEKGLIMRPRRSLFALDYIEETVLTFSKCNGLFGFEKEELQWATDVLGEYFDSVDKTDEIQRMFSIYRSACKKRKSTKCKGRTVPYRRDRITIADISYEKFLELCNQRRSVRWYQQRSVPNDLIQKAISAATLAPSACNRQPFTFKVINNAQQASEVSAIAMGTKGFSDNIPCLLVVIGNLGSYPYERDRHVIYIDAALAAMQFMLALETLGLSSCPINWPDIESREKSLASKLKLEYHERPILLIAVGYADTSGMIPSSQKKSVKLLMGE